MCTRGLQSWRDSTAADWMPSKPKPHRHRQTLSRRGRQNLRVGKTRRSECRFVGENYDSRKRKNKTVNHAAAAVVVVVAIRVVVCIMMLVANNRPCGFIADRLRRVIPTNKGVRTCAINIAAPSAVPLLSLVKILKDVGNLLEGAARCMRRKRLIF